MCFVLRRHTGLLGNFRQYYMLRMNTLHTQNILAYYAETVLLDSCHHRVSMHAFGAIQLVSFFVFVFFDDALYS